MKNKSLTLYLVWHQRDNNNPAYKWLRQQITETVDTITKGLADNNK
jgi:hypothetical protein